MSADLFHTAYIRINCQLYAGFLYIVTNKFVNVVYLGVLLSDFFNVERKDSLCCFSVRNLNEHKFIFQTLFLLYLNHYVNSIIIIF